ncbi:thioesterase II family protein [Streptomyces sp. NPDC003023]|uniref:thioesterase II family protein n=1 Tax=Streptomyces sp. NPDC003023 TaxID=3364675 RepID=UPI003682B971
MNHRASPWLLCRRPNPQAAIRLYCFPHSGGSPGEYLRWADDLPQVEVWGVQLPGRGSRLLEPPVRDIDELVRQLLEVTSFEGSFAFFGHSLGALISFHAAVALLEADGRLPRHLLLSAMPPPHTPLQILDPSGASDGELLSHMGRYGTVPPDALADPALRSIMAEAYRVDLEVLASCQGRQHPVLPVPTTLFAGSDDPLSEQLEEWDQYLTAPARTIRFPGGHFYLRNEHGALMRALHAVLQP